MHLDLFAIHPCVEVLSSGVHLTPNCFKVFFGIVYGISHLFVDYFCVKRMLLLVILWLSGYLVVSTDLIALVGMP